MSFFSEDQFREKLQSDAKRLPEINEALTSRLLDNIETSKISANRKKNSLLPYWVAAAAVIIMATSLYYANRVSHETVEAPTVSVVTNEPVANENLRVELAKLIERYNPDRLGEISNMLIANADRVVYKNNFDELKKETNHFMTQYFGEFASSTDSQSE